MVGVEVRGFPDSDPGVSGAMGSRTENGVRVGELSVVLVDAGFQGRPHVLEWVTGLWGDDGGSLRAPVLRRLSGREVRPPRLPRPLSPSLWAIPFVLNS